MSLSGNGLGGAARYTNTQVARGDYAANVGDETRFDGKCLNISPNDYNLGAPGVAAVFPPPITSFSGVTFCGTAVKLRQITDGTSKTIALGERFIPAQSYEGRPTWIADDWHMYVGFQDDTVRSTYYEGGLQPVTHTPRSDTDSMAGLSQKQLDDLREVFGSAHPAGCLVSLCDGSVDLVAYDIDPHLFRQMGDRADGGERKEPRRQ